MDPVKIRSWQRVFRDFVVVSVGVFLLVYGTVRVHEPTALAIVLGAGLAACGLPPVLRADEWFRRTSDEESEK